MDLPKVVAKQRDYFFSNATKSYEFRLKALKKMRAAVQANEEALEKAMYEDLGKVAQESYMTEIGLVLAEFDLAIRKLKKWMKPKRVRTSVADFPGESTIEPQPYGNVLIMSAWNYPFQLTFEPLVGAMAAGNTILLKPSAMAPHTMKVMADMVHAAFPAEYIEVVQGDHQDNPDLLRQHYNYIFFTGGKAVGKLVLEAAIPFTTPVTLELGGKSPCIIDETADIETAGKRLAWGKILNSGQTCVAPDFAYVHKSVMQELIAAVSAALDSFYPEGALKADDYPHIVNERHFERVVGLMKGATIERGGHTNADTLQIEPTILTDVTWDSPVMGEEIFGPLLPVLPYDDLDEVITLLNSKPEPLAAYMFSTHEPSIEKVTSRLLYGGGCINDVVLHVASDSIPFGGVGASGMGRYHGKYTFNTFSHMKSLLRRPTFVDNPLRFPPYSDKKLSILRHLLH
ncbi:MAG: aldehyde dehydrogenase [Clostridia bacterium]|nr:aldehyde dehydrogenase [Clostridia bacterium]